MPYLVETYDKPGHHDLRLRVREEHLGFLAAHAELLLACGAKLSDDGETASGGIYLLDVDSREQAEALIAQDPFTRADLFDRVVVTRWRKAYLASQNYL